MLSHTESTHVEDEQAHAEMSLHGGQLSAIPEQFERTEEAIPTDKIKDVAPDGGYGVCIVLISTMYTFTLSFKCDNVLHIAETQVLA